MYSEMLGNKYFLARNYKNAAVNFQHALSTDPVNKSARKKLIICYSQIGQIRKALENFYQLVKEDIDFIINTDAIADDCPCPELTAKFGSVYPFESESYDLKLMLAMLWLYCSPEKSLDFFKRLLLESPKDTRIIEITNLLEEKINSTNKLTH